MKVFDTEIQNLDLSEPTGLVTLIVKYLCAKAVPTLDEGDAQLVQHFLDSASKTGLSFEQLNELLLLLRQNRLSEPFFKYFFRPRKTDSNNHSSAGGLTLEELRSGISSFRALAMLRYGNFVFARRALNRMNSVEEIAASFRKFPSDRATQLAALRERPAKVLDVKPIGRDCTWLTGQISARSINRELEVAKAELDRDTSRERSEWLRQFIQRLESMKESQSRVERLALNNIGVYLTWDYLDVYVATSMRNKWEFEETFDFVREVFGQDIVRPLKLRYFDPTQCKCSNPRDKGLLEGLMLNRAFCTIYMAQESDTLGKDSELAVTLAQGKPVIAYVPDLQAEQYAEKIRARPLEFIEKRWKILDADGILDDPACIARFSEIDPDGDSTIQSFSAKLTDYRSKQNFSLAYDLDEQFKAEVPEFRRVCNLLAEAEVLNFHWRDSMLRGAHPLSMQIDMKTGTANGVLVAHSPTECARLLHDLITNDLDLEIVHERNDSQEFTLLKERSSNCAFRAVTHNEKLTNSFWNLFQ